MAIFEEGGRRGNEEDRKLQRPHILRQSNSRAGIITSSERSRRRGQSSCKWNRLSLAQHLVCGVLMILISFTELSLGLRDVRITLPMAVKRGDNANLICNYDIEGDTLYTVKYYKGRKEFYRYTPKENPAIKVFPHPGVRIEETMSNGSCIVLLAQDTSLSGKYSCEVSADAPSFHTTIVSAEMEVVEPPEQRPSITGIQSRYRIGDIIEGSCTSAHSRPAANLTWTINDIPIPQSNILDSYKVTKNADSTESSTLGVYYRVQHSTFYRGKAKLRCHATIYNVYKAFSDKTIDEVMPRFLATQNGVGGSGANLLQSNAPYDESSNGLLPDHQMDENGMMVQRDHDSYQQQQQYNDLTAATSSAPASARLTMMSSRGDGGLWIDGGRSGGGALILALLFVLVGVVSPSTVVGVSEKLLEHCHRKRHIVRAVISQYLIIVASLIISAIVTQFQC